MSESPPNQPRTLRWQVVFLGLSLEVLVFPLICTALVGWLCGHTPLAEASPHVWLIFAPLLYFVWLMLFLGLCVLDTTLMGRFYEKPRHSGEKGAKTPNTFSSLLISRTYMRGSVLKSLPWMNLLWRVYGLRWLAFRAISPSVHWKDVSLLVPDITDPDLTYIDSHVVLGDASRLVAHSFTRLPDGRTSSQYAPIHLKTACTIGGSSLIELGVTVGEYALVEPFSRVVAFTQIPPGEVWGGNPAVFRRQRDMNKAAASELCTSDASADVIALVAQALGVPADRITADSSTANAPEWDSLGMLAIAAAIHARFGLTLAPETLFGMNSVAKIQRVITQTRPPAAAGEPGDAEFLPLMEPAIATAKLAQQPASSEPGPSPITVAIASSFVAEPLAGALRLWSQAFGLKVDIQFASFNQIPQTLLAPDSLFHRNTSGINVVLTRPEDLPGGQSEADTLLAALKTFAAETTSLLLVADLPPQLYPAQSQPDSEALRSWWREQITAIPRVRALDFAALITELGRTASRDTAMATAASTPFSQALYQHLGIALARVVRATRVPAKKVLAVDADGTLWHGVVGEDGVAAVTVTPSFQALQQALSALRARGVLLVLVSKNAPEDVWRVLSENPGMLLHREDFSAVRINWQPKSANLRELAAELNIGLDSFVFLDDNHAERLEVAAHCPQVTIIPGEAADFADTLSKLWLFDGAGESREDTTRAMFQRQDTARQAARDPEGDLTAYLKSLELVVEIRPASAGELPRVSQLSLKTNQFNTALQRYTLPELRTLSQTHEVWAVAAKDKFGDYGLIGGLTAIRSSAAYAIASLFVSCRALGRGVEAALLHVLARHARECGATVLRVAFTAGPRNEPARDFLRHSGFEETSSGQFDLSLKHLPPLPEHVRLGAV